MKTMKEIQVWEREVGMETKKVTHKVEYQSTAEWVTLTIIDPFGNQEELRMPIEEWDLLSGMVKRVLERKAYNRKPGSFEAEKDDLPESTSFEKD